MDETRDIVDVVTRISAFFAHESCGKCTPCREGVYHMNQIMTKLNAGRATADDISHLEDLSWVMQKASNCGLGQAAPIPVDTTLRHFRHEYLRKLM
jgi:NADH-quinone oxidoreductase subunit F